jgi:hypothetical protein
MAPQALLAMARSRPFPRCTVVRFVFRHDETIEHQEGVDSVILNG